MKDNKVHKKIMSNMYTKDSLMTYKQLMKLLFYVSKYEFKLPNMTGWTAQSASKAINLIEKRIRQRIVKLRKTPYDVDRLRSEYACKYPKMFYAIDKYDKNYYFNDRHKRD
jgi:hypothetical protein